MSTLDSLAQSAIRKAEKAGATQAEAFVIESNIRSVYVERSLPRLADDKMEIGLAVRAFVGKCSGLASGVISSADDLEETVRGALSIARTTKEDPNFRSLASGGRLSGEIRDVFCQETSEVDGKEIVAAVMGSVRSAEKKKDVRVPLGMLRLGSYSMHVCNSLGVDFGHRGTMIFAHLTAKAARGAAVGEGVERVWSTRFSLVDFEGIGRCIADKALRNLEAGAFSGRLEGVAVIDPIEAAGLLDSIKFATSSEQVNRGTSPWSDKIGAEVASRELTILDDGMFPGGIRSAVADDEGVRTTKKPIISNGVLESFVYDSYNANIAGVKPTGNGFRRGTRTIEGAFGSPLSCVYSNMVVESGNKSVEDIVSGIERGVFVERFASPEVNPVTGGFGCEVRAATLIEGGLLGKHVRYALLTGNIYEQLRNVVGIGNDVRIVEDTVLPTLAFSGVTLVGQD